MKVSLLQTKSVIHSVTTLTKMGSFVGIFIVLYSFNLMSNIPTKSTVTIKKGLARVDMFLLYSLHYFSTLTCSSSLTAHGLTYYNV